MSGNYTACIALGASLSCTPFQHFGLLATAAWNVRMHWRGQAGDGKACWVSVLQATRGHAATGELFDNINSVIVGSLKVVAATQPNHTGVAARYNPHKQHEALASVH